MSLIGLNIGGTTTTLVAGDEQGNIIARSAFPTRPDAGTQWFYDRVLAEVRALDIRAAAVGVAIGGPLDARNGVILSPPHLPHLHDFPLRARLERDLGLPVSVHHDAAACALAEYRWGPDAGIDGIAYLTCGTGFGAGIVIGGRARYGQNGQSPELGHVRYRETGPDTFDKPGAYDGYGSAKALALLARSHDGERYRNALPADVARAAQAGEKSAIAALRDNEEAVGAACALLADLLVLDVIVLGSLAAYLGETWIDAVRAAFAREALPANVAHCRLRAAMPHVQDRSALAAALERPR